MELFFDRPKETSNRFYRIPLWIIAFVAVADFPNENWYESKIKECFAGLCEVAETDKACLTRDDFSPLQLLLEVNEHLEIPYDVKISAKHGVARGAVGATQLLPPAEAPRCHGSRRRRRRRLEWCGRWRDLPREKESGALTMKTKRHRASALQGWRDRETKVSSRLKIVI